MTRLSKAADACERTSVDAEHVPAVYPASLLASLDRREGGPGKGDVPRRENGAAERPARDRCERRIRHLHFPCAGAQSTATRSAVGARDSGLAQSHAARGEHGTTGVLRGIRRPECDFGATSGVLAQQKKAATGPIQSAQKRALSIDSSRTELVALVITVLFRKTADAAPATLSAPPLPPLAELMKSVDDMLTVMLFAPLANTAPPFCKAVVGGARMAEKISTLPSVGTRHPSINSFTRCVDCDVSSAAYAHLRATSS